MKLGDIKFNDAIDYTTGNALSLLDDGGASIIIMDDENYPEGVEAKFIYLDPVSADILTKTPGWYYSDDDGLFEYCQNDRDLPFGQGFMVDNGADEGALVYSGSVRVSEKEVNLSPAYNFTGNCAPAEITFGDLTFNEFVDYTTGNALSLLDDGGASIIIMDDENYPEGVEAKFIYLDPVSADILTKTPGWYYSDDDGTFEHCQNGRKIPAGQGFMVDNGADDAQLIIPSAISKN